MTLTKLSAFDLNKFRFSGVHTPLTPEQIEALHAASASGVVTSSK